MKGKRFALFCTVVLAGVLCGSLSRASGNERSWEDAVPVSIAGSPITVAAVRSTWATDYDYALNRQGPVYFNDCAQWVNENSVDAMHVQLMFALVDSNGALKSAALPLDVHIDAKPGVAQGASSSCRDHAYANGTQHLWLVAWVSRADFADGASWIAPTGSALTEDIRAALPATFRHGIQF
jgi:hypothetical protein